MCTRLAPPQQRRDREVPMKSRSTRRASVCAPLTAPPPLCAHRAWQSSRATPQTLLHMRACSRDLLARHSQPRSPVARQLSRSSAVPCVPGSALAHSSPPRCRSAARSSSSTPATAAHAGAWAAWRENARRLALPVRAGGHVCTRARGLVCSASRATPRPSGAGWLRARRRAQAARARLLLHLVDLLRPRGARGGGDGRRQ